MFHVTLAITDAPGKAYSVPLRIDIRFNYNQIINRGNGENIGESGTCAQTFSQKNFDQFEEKKPDSNA